MLKTGIPTPSLLLGFSISPPVRHYLPTVQQCGHDAFVNDNGSKVGEGIYMGTALSQVDDGKVGAIRCSTWESFDTQTIL